MRVSDHRRIDEVWKTFEELWRTMRLVDVKSELKRLRRSCQLPARLQDGIIEPPVRCRQQLQVASEYHCSIYFPVFNCFLAEMNRCFSDESTIMIAVQSLYMQPVLTLPLI